MTSLVVTPNVKRKTLKFEGRIAAGEHVLVRVETFDDKVGEGKSLRLRAVSPNGDTLAVFPPHVNDDDPPRPQEELVWQVDGGDATCVFDFNTVQAEKFLRCGGECLFVLDDVDNHTLYGNGFCTVAPWAKENGLDVPVDLDGYKDVGERVTVLEDEIASIGEKAEAASAEASSAKSTADSAARVAETARTDAVAAGNAAISAASSASEAQTGAAAASSAAGAAATSASDAAASAKSASDKFDALSDVAKSGRYEDLLDKPSIPSIAGLATKTELSREESRAKGVEQNILNRLARTPSLDDGGKVPASQLPSYVDDVIEYGDRTRFPAFGESGKIYVDMSTNRLYRWTGTVYVQIPSGLALGETASTAYPGDKGAANASDIANLKTSKQDALDARQLAAVNSGVTSEKVADMVAKSDVVPVGGGTEVIARIGGKEIKIPDAGDPGSISDSAGNVIAADGSATIVGDSWTCNGVVLRKREGRDDYWENAERHWGLGYDPSAKWMFTNGHRSARSDAPADATKLSFVIGELTYDATIGRADSVVMAGDVVPKGTGTETIATIGGKDIKAPASPVSSVNGKTGAVNLVAQDVGALALSSRNEVGSSFSMDFEGEEASGGNLSFGVGMGPAGRTFIANKLYCSDRLYANGFVITNTSGAPGESVLNRIQEYGGDYKTALQEVNGLIGTAIDATAAYPMSTIVGGALKDRTVNHATAGGTFTFPARTGTNARDFVLVIDALETAPTVTFPGSVTYVSEQDAADIWAAEAGKVNAWYFSEVTDGVFMVCHKAMGAVAQS